MNVSRPLQFAWHYLAESREQLFSAVCWRSAFAVLPMQAPLLAGVLVDGLHGKAVSLYGWSLPADSPGLVLRSVATVLLAVAAATAVSAYMRTIVARDVGRRFVGRIRRTLLRKLEFASLEFHHRHAAGELLHRLISDPSSTQAFVERMFIDTPALLIRISYPVLMLFLIDPILALLPLSALPLQWLLTRKMQQRLQRITADRREDKSRLTSTMKENFDGIETVQTLCAENIMVDRICEQAADMEADQTKARRYTGMIMACVWGLTALCFALSLWYGGLRVIEGGLTAGDLVVFSGFVTFVYRPFRQVTRLGAAYRNGAVGLERIEEILNAAGARAIIEERYASKPLIVGDGRIEFRNVSLCYAPGEERLSGICLTVEGRSLTAITGRSGSGKTSLLRLIPRLHDPSAGEVLIDGQNLRDCTLQSVRECVAIVPQQPYIFSASVIDNLRLARPDASLEEIEEACDLAGAREFILRTRDGFDTRLGNGGVRLSGGEAQRIAIARALLRRPAVLLLDEPAAALDSEAEAALLERLYRLKARMTIVVVAHRLKAINRADRIIVVDQGRSVECGTHNELLFSGPVYGVLYS